MVSKVGLDQSFEELSGGNDMGEVIKMKRNKKPIQIDGKTYIYLGDFAERVGIAENTVYQWRYEGRVASFTRMYLGRLVFEEKAIEPFKRSLMIQSTISVYR